MIGMKILFVDDDTGFLDQAQMFLERIDKDLDVHKASSADEALDKLEEEEYDAIISDYQMPGMDGLEFLEEIRKERDNDIPFIMFTGKGREEVAIDALNLGADRYLQKKGGPRSQYKVVAQAVKQEVTHYKTEKQNRELRRDLNETFNAISHPVFLLDSEHKILRTNEATEEFFGLDEDKLLGEFCHRIAHDQDEPIDNCPLERSLDTKEPEELEFYSEELDKYFIAKTAPILDEEGKIKKMVHQEIDVTDIKKKNIELKQTKRRFDAIYHDPDIFIGLLELDGTVISANKTSLDFIGADESEVEGKKFWNTPWWEHSEELQERLKEAISRAAEGEYQNYEATHVGKEGKTVSLEFSLKPVTNESGEVVSLLAEGKHIMRGDRG